MIIPNEDRAQNMRILNSAFFNYKKLILRVAIEPFMEPADLKEKTTCTRVGAGRNHVRYLNHHQPHGLQHDGDQVQGGGRKVYQERT